MNVPKISLRAYLPVIKWVVVVVVTAAATIFGWGVAWGGHAKALAGCSGQAEAAVRAASDAQERLVEVEAWRSVHEAHEAAVADVLQDLHDATIRLEDKLDEIGRAVGRLEGSRED